MVLLHICVTDTAAMYVLYTPVKDAAAQKEIEPCFTPFVFVGSVSLPCRCYKESLYVLPE